MSLVDLCLELIYKDILNKQNNAKSSPIRLNPSLVINSNNSNSKLQCDKTINNNDNNSIKKKTLFDLSDDEDDQDNNSNNNNISISNITEASDIALSSSSSNLKILDQNNSNNSFEEGSSYCEEGEEEEEDEEDDVLDFNNEILSKYFKKDVKLYQKFLSILIEREKLTTDHLYQYSISLPLDFITFLDFQSTSITTNQIYSISKIKTLRSLNLSNCQFVNSQSIYALRKLPKLLTLDISNTSITDNSMHYINEMPRIQVLNISSNRNLRDSALLYLSKNQTLKEIIARSLLFTDKSVCEFTYQSFVSLSLLNVTNSLIGDISLEYFLRLPSLGTLVLFGSQVTKDALVSLEKQMKLNSSNGCVIDYPTKTILFKKTSSSIYIKSNNIDIVQSNNKLWPIQDIKSFIIKSFINRSSPNSSFDHSFDSATFHLKLHHASPDSLLNNDNSNNNNSKNNNNNSDQLRIFKDPFSNSPTKRDLTIIHSSPSRLNVFNPSKSNTPHTPKSKMYKFKTTQTPLISPKSNTKPKYIQEESDDDDDEDESGDEDGNDENVNVNVVDNNCNNSHKKTNGYFLTPTKATSSTALRKRKSTDSQDKCQTFKKLVFS
ncbi:hypothetical protein CYY_004305 [Polysphondylium violaceum]|uniref:Leucine-rich repeat-containing protein n=1 Tax=Polysphondylium violaceum TaxID=133409 RepID=A0A8J4UT36_9MYCE|nr:hypothetical protein CYY_004305 [Polysphondylium violaceum]